MPEYEDQIREKAVLYTKVALDVERAQQTYNTAVIALETARNEEKRQADLLRDTVGQNIRERFIRVNQHVVHVKYESPTCTRVSLEDLL